MSYYKPLYTDNIKHVRGYKSTVMCVCDGVYDVCVCVLMKQGLPITENLPVMSAG